LRCCGQLSGISELKLAFNSRQTQTDALGQKTQKRPLFALRKVLFVSERESFLNVVRLTQIRFGVFDLGQWRLLKRPREAKTAASASAALVVAGFN